MGFTHKAFAAAGVGFAACALVGCGSSGQLLSQSESNQLSTQLNSVSQAMQDGDCRSAESALYAFENRLAALNDINSTLVANLTQGATTVQQLTSARCASRVQTAPNRPHTTTTAKPATTPTQTQANTTTSTTGGASPTSPNTTTTDTTGGASPTSPTTTATTTTSPNGGQGLGGAGTTTTGGDGNGSGSGNGSGNGYGYGNGGIPGGGGGN
jgi:hypothetical protein